MTSRISRRRFAAALAAAFAALASPVWAQAPSDKPLRIIAAGPPGGSLDIVGRLLGDGLQKEFKQTVIVETKPGAGGAIAVNDLMQAPHDGNTVLVSLDGMVSEIPHIVKLKFDMAKDVKPIAELARGGLVLVGHPSVPAKNLAEVIAYVKANAADQGRQDRALCRQPADAFAAAAECADL
jgi:tripartite-type tricarboxylate transporter receptor subunit TctC